MLVQSIPSYAVSRRNVSFGDDCYAPSSYRPKNAMNDLKAHGYEIHGNGTRDAFEKLYDDVNSVLSTMARSKDGVWKRDYERGVRTYDNTLKYTVSEWELPRDTFSSLLTRFWEKNKTNNFSDIKGSVTNFLTNVEGMEKPGFFQSFMSKFADYFKKEGVLTDVVKIFLKDGKHRLR